MLPLCYAASLQSYLTQCEGPVVHLLMNRDLRFSFLQLGTKRDEFLTRYFLQTIRLCPSLRHSKDKFGVAVDGRLKSEDTDLVGVVNQALAKHNFSFCDMRFGKILLRKLQHNFAAS